MALENPALRQLLGSKTYQEKIAAVIVDECHCISQWGGEFRPKYSALEKFRAFVPTHIPFLATSATLPPSALDEVSTKLNIDLTSSFFLNLGNDRPNITPKVIQIKSTDDYEALKKLVKDGVITPDDLEKTIIYVDGVNATQHLVREIRTWFPASFHDYIDCLNSRRTPFAKTTVMDRFRRGLVRILVATEAAGMGADIPDITRVIQFGLCKSLSIWTQRAGRAGRSPGLHATAYLLVQNAALADDGKVWGRKVEEPFRKWIQALGCRRDVSDEYFDSPGPRKHPTGACCDNCVQAAANNEPSHDSDDGSDEDESDTTSSADSSSASDSDNDTVNANGKRTIRSREKGARKRCATGPKRAGKRRGQHLQDVRAALETWRYRKKRDEYTPSSFGASALLPDLILTALASNTSLNTVDDLSSLKIPWMFAKKHGDEVLDIVRRVDTARKQVLDSAKIEKREKKKRETAERNERKRQEKLAMTALKKAQRGTVRAPLPPAALPSSPFFFTGPSLPFHAQVSRTHTAPFEHRFRRTHISFVVSTLRTCSKSRTIGNFTVLACPGPNGCHDPTISPLAHTSRDFLLGPT
ncbi:hypothetical protein PLICRDRAFT_157733 [Plicaturopsis crispa FD-325 SS-3]|nr:hypothetical protein PLICRDRAFT_157733 [Plicaturopsis crispa FD-325 SS-3]